jgi:hypothetical protein
MLTFRIFRHKEEAQYQLRIIAIGFLLAVTQN